MTIRRRSTDGSRPDAWAKQLSSAMIGAVDEDTRVRSGPLVLVVGGGWFGRRLAGRLAATHQVHHLDTDSDVVTDVESHETSHAPDLTASTALAATGVGDDDVAVVATGLDARNLLVTQQLRTRFGLEQLLVVLEDPRNHEAFDFPGVEVVCTGTVLSTAVESIVHGAEEDDVTTPPPD